MKRSTLFVASMVVASLAFGGTAMGVGARSVDRTRLKDASCVAAVKLQIKDRTQDKLKDGSCVELAKATKRTRSRSKLKTGTCDGTGQRLRDGSCISV